MLGRVSPELGSRSGVNGVHLRVVHGVNVGLDWRSGSRLGRGRGRRGSDSLKRSLRLR